jgi:hydrogenase-4 component F
MDFEDGSLFKNEPESVCTGGILLLLAAMTLAILSRHLALQWVAIEATTLASAPLIYYHQNRRSLEAAWKYLILCSVGIAVALLGIFFLRMTIQDGSHDLTLAALLERAGTLNHRWLSTAFIFMLVGYGTKMGLAPLHTWLPDAHSEAPSPVSAMLSGALLNCAFLGILRMQQICAAAGMASFGGDLLILFGLLHGTGAFILRQTDSKRMLAYSSVEHMGILYSGRRLGGLGLFGSFCTRSIIPSSKPYYF